MVDSLTHLNHCFPRTVGVPGSHVTIGAQTLHWDTRRHGQRGDDSLFGTIVALLVANDELDHERLLQDGAPLDFFLNNQLDLQHLPSIAAVVGARPEGCGAGDLEAHGVWFGPNPLSIDEIDFIETFNLLQA